MSTALDSPHQEPIPEEQLGRPNLSTQQGDKIGRILAQWVSVCFGKLHENNILGYFFQRLRLCINTCRNGWASFWANLSQTHLVTLQLNNS
jgi:hypothetical protein